MILQFKVRNFLSIREEQTLSFEATADTTHENMYVVEKGKTRVLKMGMIFGANASGKTNILMALDFLRKFVLDQKNEKDKPTEHVPFLLDLDSRNRNGSFELSFYIGETLYIYSLELNHSFVQSEKLVYYPGIKPAVVFERYYNKDKDLTEIEIGSTIKLKSAEKNLIEGNTLPNMSVIAAYSKLNLDFPELKVAYNFFRGKMFPIIRPKTSMREWTTKKVERNEDTKIFILKLLNSAGINIADIKIETIDNENTPDLTNVLKSLDISNEQKRIFLSNKSIILKNLLFLHKVGESDSIGFTLDLESAGTNRLFELGGVLQEGLLVDGLLNIDELESSMHPDLVIHFINTFLANSKEAQLVCTTHEINILSEQDNLRKDIIWFTQKSPEGATELYSLADFNIRRELSFINAYKAGKFGAKPRLGSIYLNE
jgi:AAA15 family ATPase/GTPase